MPATVSPVRKRSAFCVQVPSSSLWLSVIRFSSLARMTARISMPTVKRSRGWSMRETEIASIGSRETMPQPMSAKAPNGSRWVMRTSITSPRVRPDIYCARQRSCALRRESTAVIRPAASRMKSVTTKHTGLLTREMMAMSRTVPSRMPSAPSSRGMMPRMHFKSTIRLCSLSQMMLRASRMRASRMASESAAAFSMAAWFSALSIRWPSG